MKRVLVSQRVEYIDSYGEYRDALDQKWAAFLLSVNIIPFLLPNNPLVTKELLKTINFDGVLLTGGNSLQNYGGISKERDQIEKEILALCLKESIPLIGICRGMQVIQDYYSIPLQPITGHINKRQVLNIQKGCKFESELMNYKSVNSFHDLGTFSHPSDIKSLSVSSYAQDGVVMSIEHTSMPVFGFMWHPEREETFHVSDLKIFKEVFHQL